MSSVEAVEWLKRRGISVERIIITLHHTLIVLDKKPYCDLVGTQSVFIEGSNKGRIVHLAAPLKGCEVRWSELLQ